MRVLDLFCGGGGAAEGYARAGFEVVGVDIDPQPCYPYTFIQVDVFSFLLTLPYITPFDLIHASPPSSQWNDTRGKDEPALIEPLRDLLQASDAPYVIENVPAAPLDGITLCGSMFGLDIQRHRVFETSWFQLAPGHPECRGMVKKAAERRGWDYRDMSVTGKGRHAGWGERAAELLDIRHPMRQHDLKEAIPPAYTEWIGQQLCGQ